MADLGDLCAVSITRAQITVTRVSADELRVLQPLESGRAVEWVLQRYPATGCWGVWAVRGIAGSVVTPLIEDGSTMEYAFQVGLAADPYQSGTTYDFVGGGHGSEVLQAVSIALDGAPLVGSGSGFELVVSQIIKTLMPKGSAAGQVIGATQLRHRFTASGLQVEHSHAITMPGVSYRTAYAAMLPGHKASCNVAQCDNGPAIPLQFNNTIPARDLQGKTYSLWHTDRAVNPYRLTMRIDSPEVGGIGWSLAATPCAWLFDRTSYQKWYVNWIGDQQTPARYSMHRQSYTVEMA